MENDNSHSKQNVKTPYWRIMIHQLGMELIHIPYTGNKIYERLKVTIIHIKFNLIYLKFWTTSIYWNEENVILGNVSSLKAKQFINKFNTDISSCKQSQTNNIFLGKFSPLWFCCQTYIQSLQSLGWDTSHLI